MQKKAKKLVASEDLSIFLQLRKQRVRVPVSGDLVVEVASEGTQTGRRRP